MDLANKPFLQFVTKLDSQNNSPKYSCNVCGLMFRGNYHRVGAHLIANKGHVIHKCHCCEEKINEVFRISNQHQVSFEVLPNQCEANNH
jgi:hypothetical protein